MNMSVFSTGVTGGRGSEDDGQRDRRAFPREGGMCDPEAGGGGSSWLGLGQGCTGRGWGQGLIPGPAPLPPNSAPNGDGPSPRVAKPHPRRGHLPESQP